MSPDVVAYIVTGVGAVFMAVVGWLARNAVEGAKEQAKDHENRLREVEKQVAKCAATEDLKDLERRLASDFKEGMRELREDVRGLRLALEARHD